MFIAALFTLLKTGNNPSIQPIADEWINKLWSIHAMEYYSAIKTKQNKTNSELQKRRAMDRS